MSSREKADDMLRIQYAINSPGRNCGLPITICGQNPDVMLITHKRKRPQFGGSWGRAKIITPCADNSRADAGHLLDMN